jgi:hypothetical protein
MNRLVVARYSENLDWLLNVPDSFEIIVYNKGDAITDPKITGRCAQIIARPNVGRESETYLHHISTHREANDDFTVFAQGGVFEHSPDFISALKEAHSWKDVQPLSWGWKTDRNIPPNILLDEFGRKLDGRPRIRPEYFSLSLWGPLDFTDVGANGMGMVYRLINQMPEGRNIAADYLRKAKLPAIADEAEAHKVGVFSYGAIFAVRNRNMAALSNEAVNALIDMQTSGIVAYGYIMERMWLHIFGEKFHLPVRHAA